MARPLPTRLVRVLPPRAAGSVRLVEVEADGQRLLLWPGEGPSDRPAHPALPQLLGAGRVEDQVVWVERLPSGELLDQLEPGVPGVARALADVVGALIRLHGSGRAHGGLEASTVLVGLEGGCLLGASGEGEASEDRRQLAELVRRWLPDLEEAREEATLLELAELLDTRATGEAQPVLSPRPATERALVLHLEPTEDDASGEDEDEGEDEGEGGGKGQAPGDAGAVDEVRYEIGLDEQGRGLLDTWAGRTAPGEEPTGAIDSHHGLAGELTALLARLAAGVGRDAAPERFASAEGLPSRAVKELIADEPLDPLPVPEGLPLSGTGFLEPAGSTDITAIALRPSMSSEVTLAGRVTPPGAGPGGEVTAELERTTSHGEAPEISATLLVVAVLVALVAGALGTWLVLGGGLP